MKTFLVASYDDLLLRIINLICQTYIGSFSSNSQTSPNHNMKHYSVKDLVSDLSSIQGPYELSVLGSLLSLQ